MSLSPTIELDICGLASYPSPMPPSPILAVTAYDAKRH